MSVIFYLICIAAANILTAKFAPMEFGMFLVPVGTLLIGINFVLRDMVQEQFGRGWAYASIFTALVISGISSVLLGDGVSILLASALAFLISETTDTEIYERLRLPIASRVFWSGSVGGFLDSVIFVVVGLSPLGEGFLPWEAVPLAIAGQIIVKTIMQGLGAGIVWTRLRSI